MRENLEWLARASNWAKFDVTASLGLVHKGSLLNGHRIMKPYLPGGSVPNKYSEGGALYALGLIYTGRKVEVEDAMRAGLAEGADPVVQHGAALGLGVTAVASQSEGESCLNRKDMAPVLTVTQRFTSCYGPCFSRTTRLRERRRDTRWARSCWAQRQPGPLRRCWHMPEKRNTKRSSGVWLSESPSFTSVFKLKQTH